MPADHPLQRPPVVRAIERAASAHLGRRWAATGFTDLDDRASHRCGLLHGDSLSAAQARTSAQWQSIGRTLAMAHQVHDTRFGLAPFDGFFGPLPQDNRPVGSNRWTDFYAERRLLPYLRSAVDSGHLPTDLSRGVDRLIARLPSLSGPEPRPSLLHGDAQQNNILTTATGAVWVDVAPYFGHPEIDLALLDCFAPVPDEVFGAYAEVTPIDPGFAQRRALWRLFAYLAVISVDATSALGTRFLARTADVVARYR